MLDTIKRIVYRTPKIVINHKSKIMEVKGDPSVIYKKNPILLIKMIRIATESGVYLSKEARNGIEFNVRCLDDVPVKTIRNEFIKILINDNFKDGLNMLKSTGVILYMMPEFDGIDSVTTLTDPRIPIDLWHHTLKVIENTNPTLEDRLAAFLHDMGKIETMDVTEERVSFSKHAQMSEEIANKFLNRFKFKKDIIDKVCFACRYHMSYHWSKINDKDFSKRIDRFGYDSIKFISNLLKADTIDEWRLHKLNRTMEVVNEKMKENYISPIKKVFNSIVRWYNDIFVKDVNFNTLYF